MLVGHANHLPPGLPLGCRFGSGEYTIGRDIEDTAHDQEGEQVRLVVFPIPQADRGSSEVEITVLGESECIGRRTVSMRRNLPARYLTVTTLMKDEGQFLLEWIAYYRILGADHFVIYDNRSLYRSSIRRLLKPLIDENLVTLLDWDYPYKYGSADNSWRFCQRGQMHHALYKYGACSTWMLFIDVDEFIAPSNSTQQSLLPLLRSADEDPSIAGLQFKMIWFGNNGHHTPPPGLVIENYTRRSRDVISEGREKCAMKCQATRTMFIHAPKSTEPGTRIIKVSPDDFRINHYFATSARRANQINEELNEVEDTGMLRFAARIREQLAR